MSEKNEPKKVPLPVRYKPMKKDYGAGHKRSALRDAVKKKKAATKKKQMATYTSKYKSKD